MGNVIDGFDLPWAISCECGPGHDCEKGVFSLVFTDLTLKHQPTSLVISNINLQLDKLTNNWQSQIFVEYPLFSQYLRQDKTKTKLIHYKIGLGFVFVHFLSYLLKLPLGRIIMAKFELFSEDFFSCLSFRGSIYLHSETSL